MCDALAFINACLTVGLVEEPGRTSSDTVTLVRRVGGGALLAIRPSVAALAVWNGAP